MRLALFLTVAVLAVAYAVWVYVRMELAVPVRGRLAALRAASLLLLVILLFDPRLPNGGGVPTERWVLLDRSLSMGEEWPAAAARAADLADEGWTVVGFGDGLISGGETAMPAAPDAFRTLLADALERSAEVGVGSVTVISDGRFEDPVRIEAALGALPLTVSFELMEGSRVHAGVDELLVPDDERGGSARTATFEVYGSGADSVDVEIREEGALVAAGRYSLPAPGFRQPIEIEVPPANGTGRLRYTATARVEADVFPSDDTAVDYAMAGHPEGALILISLRPDWEPRYLLPVLEQVTGLPARGYLRVGTDRFAAMGRAADRGAPLDSAAVRAAAQDAALLVIHGVDGREDAWATALVSGARGRTLFFPVRAGGAYLAGVQTAPARGGEWYASQSLPPSSLAGDLGRIRVQGLPPLTGVLPLAGDTDGDVPLTVQLSGTGSGQAALVLRTVPAGRQAVTLASGFWRWGAREGDGRDAYRTLWSGVAGWLLSGDGAASSPEVQPTKWVFARGEEVVFRVPGPEEGRVRLKIDSSVETVMDTTLESGTPSGLGVFEPGLYSYSVVEGGAGVSGAGRFDVEARTDEMVPATFRAVSAEGTPVAGGVIGSRGLPVRTMMWPYLLIIALLCIEWIARRRAGLR
jgi:hypothetical protein